TVSPANGEQGQSLTVTINGSNFQNGASSNFGAGITVNATNFVSASRLTAAITIAGNAVVGSRTVTVSNPDGETAQLANGFDVRRVVLPPSVATVSPANGEQGQSLTVTINGSNFQNGASSNFGAGITVNATNFVSASRLTAAITIAGNAAVGPRTVTVSNPDNQTAQLANGFDVRAMPLPVRQIQISGVNMFQNWEARIDVSPVTPSGNRVTIAVRPGDQITWRVASNQGFTHGVVFESRAAMQGFLNVQASQQLDPQPGFFAGNGFGTSGFGDGTELVRATVQNLPQGQQLDFTCFVHGPRMMNGTLRIE
ncbi:MAG: IPT/TIG domain-containing protein, partial [Methylococcales bacterium]